MINDATSTVISGELDTGSPSENATNKPVSPFHVSGDVSGDPSHIVQRQLDAYNARDIDALMPCFADDAQIFAHPSELLASNARQIRERHLAR